MREDREAREAGATLPYRLSLGGGINLLLLGALTLDHSRGCQRLQIRRT